MPNRLSAPMGCTAEILVDPLLLAAGLIVTAARSLATDSDEGMKASRCHGAANSLAAALARPDATPADILKVSPLVYERSGRVRTLVEMVTDEDGDEVTKLRMARLLLRTLDWR